MRDAFWAINKYRVRSGSKMASCSDGEKRHISHSDELLRLPFKPGNVFKLCSKLNCIKLASYRWILPKRRFSLQVAKHVNFFRCRKFQASDNQREQGEKQSSFKDIQS